MLNSPKKIPGDFPRESSYILAEATKNYKSCLHPLRHSGLSYLLLIHNTSFFTPEF